MIYGLAWYHPGVILFMLNICLGGWGAYLESVVTPEAFVSSTHGLPWPLLFISMVGIPWAPLYMIARPHDWLPQQSWLSDEEVQLRRKRVIQRLGYLVGLIWLSFILFRIWQLRGGS